MHKNKGDLITYKGHSLTADEGHALIYGAVGLIAGFNDEIATPLKKEPHYALAGFIVSYYLGRLLHRRFRSAEE